MKTVLLVPGFKENLRSRDYKATIRTMEESGYKVKFVPIQWDRTTIDDWLADLESEYKKYNPKEIILAGFSFGAMTVLTAAAKQNPYELWLFSLSPYFHEDIRSKNMRQSWLGHIGHRRVSAFDKLHFQDLANEINCKTLIFAGNKELDKWPGMKHRALSAKKLVEHSTLIIIDGVGHDISDKLYTKAIERALRL